MSSNVASFNYLIQLTAISSIPLSSGRVRLESFQGLIHVIDLLRKFCQYPHLHKRFRLLARRIHCNSLPLFDDGVQPQLCRLQVDPIKTSRVRVLSFRRSTWLLKKNEQRGLSLTEFSSFLLCPHQAKRQHSFWELAPNFSCSKQLSSFRF